MNDQWYRPSTLCQWLYRRHNRFQWLSREDLIKHFVSVAFNRFLSYYKDSPDLNVTKKDRTDRNKKENITIELMGEQGENKKMKLVKTKLY